MSKYDIDNSGSLDMEEVRRMYGEELSDFAMRHGDKNCNGVLDDLEPAIIRRKFDYHL